MVLFIGGKFDLLFGFNQADSGFILLLSLFVLVFLLNLAWLIIIEIMLSVKLFRHREIAVSILVPLIAVFFFIGTKFGSFVFRHKPTLIVMQKKFWPCADPCQKI